MSDSTSIQLVCRIQSYEAGLNVAKAILVGILSHAHNQELIMARKLLGIAVTIILADYIVKFSSWNHIHDL